ncbi:YbaB/EbfC family nucleoid-associated protein [Nocardia acidivorans]|uniref:YbaB/EbfC family nucleoid-associated protein n=1 Tax=Nocardia acidivorans TaxID=404580 RepID=UPI000832F871|nr:YbaB/EbfC family nucleoid-associated protein [Nocardia acidivorans]
MDRLADALSNEHTALRSDGVYVDVYANGQVRAVVIDDAVVLNSRELGTLIADLINRAREQAQEQVQNLVYEVQSDSRISQAIENIGDAPQRAPVRPAVAEDAWEEDDDPYQRKSRIAAE